MYASATTLLHGAEKSIAEDLEQLFRRAAFNVLVGNRDDHLRNHGFIGVPTGWPDVGLVTATAELDRLTGSRANTIIDELRAVTRTSEREARQIGIAADERQQMKQVFQT